MMGDNDDTGRRPVSGYHMLLNLVEKMDAKLSTLGDKIDRERAARQLTELRNAERFTALETSLKNFLRLGGFLATVAAGIIVGAVLWFLTNHK
jgi:hypothetical protein